MPIGRELTEAAHIPSVLVISDLDKLQVLGFGTKQFTRPSSNTVPLSLPDLYIWLCYKFFLKVCNAVESLNSHVQRVSRPDSVFVFCCVRVYVGRKCI